MKSEVILIISLMINVLITIKYLRERKTTVKAIVRILKAESHIETLENKIKALNERINGYNEINWEVAASKEAVDEYKRYERNRDRRIKMRKRGKRK